MKLSPPQRILVKEVNWLGDLVMSLPALHALRRGFPNAVLKVLIKRELASFFDGSGWIDEVIPYRFGRRAAGVADRRRLFQTLRAERFDLAVLFPRSFSAAFWSVLARARRRAGYASDGRSLLLTDRAPWPPVPAAGHQLYEYLFLLEETLGIEGDADAYRPDVHLPHRERMRSWLAERRQRPQAKLIALAVAAAYGPAKEWPMQSYARLIDTLGERAGAECVLVGAPSEREKCSQVASATRCGALIAAGETNVGEGMALLSLCDGFAGNDSGSMHVAGALGLPTVGLFGSTQPGRTAPLGPRTKVLYHQIECSPCLQRTCRFGHYDCLKRIVVDEVVQALADLGALG